MGQPVAWRQGAVRRVPLASSRTLTYLPPAPCGRSAADSPREAWRAPPWAVRPLEPGPYPPKGPGSAPLGRWTARAVRWSARGGSDSRRGPPSSCKARGSAEAGASDGPPGSRGALGTGIALRRSGDRMPMATSVPPGLTRAHPQAGSPYHLPGSGAARRPQSRSVITFRQPRRWAARQAPAQAETEAVRYRYRQEWAGPGGGAQADGSRVPSVAAWATLVRRRLWLRA